MFHDTEYWYKIWIETDLCFKNNIKHLENFKRLKNSDFILESKMA